MSAATKDQLLDRLENGWGTYLNRFNGLTPAQQSEFLYQQGYPRLQDLLAHVIAWWEEGLRAVPRLQADPSYQSPDVDVNTFNAAAVARFYDQEAAEVIRQFEAQRCAWMELVNALPAQAFADERINWRLNIEIIGHLEEHEIIEEKMITLSSQTITYEQLAKTIDHSLLKPELTSADVVAGCALARKYNTASVCVKPCHVKLAAQELRGSDVKVGTVIGFPHGSNTTAIKVAEAKQAMDDGAVELDMVLNIGELRGGNAEYVQADIQAVVDAAHAHGAKVKVIFENAYLTDEQKILACKLSEAAGADWVKTSTGFAPSGATIEDLRLMRANVSPKVQVKAAHGVRTLDAILAVIDAGCTRVGATATATILEDFKQRQA